MQAIAIVGGTGQPETLLADLLHWHGLSVFQVDSGQALLPLLSFISPELIIVEASAAADPREICDRIKHSPVVGHLPILVCSDRGALQSSLFAADHQADAYLCAPYSAEDVFAHIQALRPLKQQLSNNVVTSTWLDA